MYPGVETYQGLGADFATEPTGWECFEGWVHQGGWTGGVPPLRPENSYWMTPQGRITMSAYGWLDTDPTAAQPQQQFLVHIGLRYLMTQVGDQWQDVIQPEAQQFLSLLHIPQYGVTWNQAYVRVCGPVIVGNDGQAVLVVMSAEELLAPSQMMPEPITVTGTLTTWTRPGVAQTWPQLGDYILTTWQEWPTDASFEFARLWNDGTLRPGAELMVTGYPITDELPFKLVPTELNVLAMAPEDEAEPPGEWEVPLPETPRDEPAPTEPEEIPTDELPVDDEGMELPGNGPPADELPPGVEPGDAERPEVIKAGLGIPEGLQDVALASFVLFFLPGFLRGEKKHKASWGMG